MDWGSVVDIANSGFRGLGVTLVVVSVGSTSSYL